MMASHPARDRDGPVEPEIPLDSHRLRSGRMVILNPERRGDEWLESTVGFDLDTYR